MSERTPHPTFERGADWSRAALGEALDAAPAHVHDVAWGDGTRYSVGRDPELPTELAIFPETGVARLTTRSAEITLFRQAPPLLYADQVRFERLADDERLQLTLTREGRISLHIAPGAPHELATGTETPSSTMIPHSEEEGIRAGDSGAPQSPMTPPFDAPEDELSAERDRVQLVGRLGAAPRFRTTRNDVLIGTFPLAVREDDDATTWYTVRVFRERAQRLREAEHKKGQPVEVIGYRHVHEQQTRAGEPRTVEEIYAVVVKPR